MNKKTSNSEKISQHSQSINKAYVAVSLIIVGILIFGYFMVGNVEVAGSYVHEQSLADSNYDLTVDIANTGRTTIYERDYTHYTTFEIEFNIEFDEALASYTYNPEAGVDVTYGIGEQGVESFGIPEQFAVLEEDYGFVREDEEDTVILTGHVDDEDIEILNLDFHNLQINADGEDIIINNSKYIKQ